MAGTFVSTIFLPLQPMRPQGYFCLGNGRNIRQLRSRWFYSNRSFNAL